MRQRDAAIGAGGHTPGGVRPRYSPRPPRVRAARPRRSARYHQPGAIRHATARRL